MIGAINSTNSVNLSTPNSVSKLPARASLGNSKADSVSFQSKMVYAGTQAYVSKEALGFVKGLGQEAIDVVGKFITKNNTFKCRRYTGTFWEKMDKQLKDPINNAVDGIYVVLGKDADETPRLVIQKTRSLSGYGLRGKPASVEIPDVVTTDSFTKAIATALTKTSNDLNLEYNETIIRHPSLKILDGVEGLNY